MRHVAAIRAGACACDLEQHALGKSASGLPIGEYKSVALAVSVLLPTGRFRDRRAVLETALRDCAARCRARPGLPARDAWSHFIAGRPPR